MVPDIYDLYCVKGNTGDDINMSAHAKVLNDVISILETDRIIFKTYNSQVIKFLATNRSEITKYLRSKEDGSFME